MREGRYDDYDDFGAGASDVRSHETITNPDKSYIKYVVDGRDVTDHLQTTMLGLVIQEKKDGNKSETIVFRKYKPIFTDEYASSFIQNLGFFANPVVSTSTFTDEQINHKLMHFLNGALKDLLIHGDDHYISSRSWKLILDIHSAKMRVKGKDGKEKLVSGWYRHEIPWHYDAPVTEDMLSLVKDYDEECDQSAIFKKLMTEISPFVHASMNKSLNHLSVSALSETHRITQSSNYSGEQKRGITSRIFGSSKQDDKGERW